MAIVELKTSSLLNWKQDIIDRYRFLPYWWIRGVTPQSRRALAGQKLDQVLETDTMYLLGNVSDTDDLLGFAQMRRMEWDTNHFGVEIWRLDQLGVLDDSGRQEDILSALVQECVQMAQKRGCQNIQARIPIDNLPAINALEGAGFAVMEILTTWLFDLNRFPIPSKRNPQWVRDSKPGDPEPLVELARAVYTPTPDRFHMDPHLSPKASDGMYAEWIRNSFTGQMADHITVVQVDDRVVGYSTMRYFDDHDGLCNVRVAELGLGGMSAEFRNQGTITDAVIHHLEWLRHRQADFCYVGTQGNNIPPQIVWLKIGFRPATMALTLHYWME